MLGDFERLSRGQRLYERDLMISVAEAQDTNDLHETLQTFRVSVLPYFDDYDAVASDIFTATVAAVDRSHSLPTRVRETPFGHLAAKTAADVTTVACGVIRDLRFIDVDRTFETICDLYVKAGTGTERDAWIKLN